MAGAGGGGAAPPPPLPGGPFSARNSFARTTLRHSSASGWIRGRNFNHLSNPDPGYLGAWSENCSVADPGSGGAFLTPGSGMGKKSGFGSGDEQPGSYF